MTGGHWCILRTSGGKTLALANSLASAGIEVWTPRQVQTRRRQGSTITQERDIAIAPTFVFARAHHLGTLAALRALPLSAHPSFSIFHYAGRIPLVTDGEIEGLRSAEERLRVKSRRSQRKAFVLGQRVRINEGAYSGLTGVVEKADGQWVLVAFGDIEMKVDSWLLGSDDVQDGLAHMGAAA